MTSLPSNTPLEFQTVGSFFVILQRMITAREHATISKFAKVNGRATDVMVVQERVRAADQVGNDKADLAFDLGRRQPCTRR